MNFTPFSANTCKSQLHYVETEQMYIFIQRKCVRGNAATAMLHLLVKTLTDESIRKHNKLQD